MHNQLALEQRYQIFYVLQHNHSYRIIDKTIDVSAITVFNEVKCNTGTSGLSIGHSLSEVTVGSTISLVKDDDIIKIDIPNCLIQLKVSDEDLA